MPFQLDYEVLLRFENARKNNPTALCQFIQELPINSNSQLQLELIGLDIEIRLQLGDSVAPDQYLLEYPNLSERIFSVYDEVKRDFQQTYCPITRGTGGFPYEFGEHIVHEEIGRGGMGVVYRATNLRTGQGVALKVLFAYRDSKHQEAAVMQQLNHSNVVRYLEMGEVDGIPFLSMEFIDGENLKEYLCREKRTSAAQAVDWVLQATNGLGQAHRDGIVHFDVKSSNLLKSATGTISVMDFGLATTLEQLSALDHSNSKTLGSPQYMAPEFFNRRFGKPGFASDIYGLGIVLYELLTGTVPFLGDAQQLAMQICNFPPARPSDFQGCLVDDLLEEICLKAIRKNVGERYASMDEFADALRRWQKNDCQKRKPTLEDTWAQPSIVFPFPAAESVYRASSSNLGTLKFAG